MNCSYSNLLKITLPIFSFLLIENIIAFTDTAFLGRVNETQLAAASIGSLYYVCIFIVGFGFSVGTQILISHRNGEANYDKIGSLFSSSLYFLVIMAIASFSFTEIFGKYLFSQMVSSQDVLTEVHRYIKWRQWGFFAIFAVIAYRSLYVGIAQTKVLAYSSWVMGIVNFILNYALIFGKCGMPKMEIEGAALASTISEFTALALFICYTRLRLNRKKYKLSFRQIDISEIIKVLRLSSWTMLQQFVYVVMWMLLFAFIERFGQHQLAQSNIIKSVLMFVYMPMYAFGATMNTVTGNLLGENRLKEIPKVCKRIIALEYMMIVPALVILYAFPITILCVYTDDMSILEDIKPAFFCSLFSVIFALPSYTLSNLILGFGKTKATFIMELIALFIYIAMLYFTVYILNNFPFIWTLDAWYWIILICFNVVYIKYIGRLFLKRPTN